MVIPEPPPSSLCWGSQEIESGPPGQPTGSCRVFLSLHTSRGQVLSESNGLRQELAPQNTWPPWPRESAPSQLTARGVRKPQCTLHGPKAPPLYTLLTQEPLANFQSIGANPHYWGRLHAQDPFPELRSTFASAHKAVDPALSNPSLWQTGPPSPSSLEA